MVQIFHSVMLDKVNLNLRDKVESLKKIRILALENDKAGAVMAVGVSPEINQQESGLDRETKPVDKNHLLPMILFITR